MMAVALFVAFSTLLAPAGAADQATDDFNLGVGFYRDQRWQLAADTFEQFVNQYPEHPRTNLARVYLGLSFSSLEQYDKAREQFAANASAVPDGPNAADVLYRLGECSYYLKEYATAVDQLETYLDKHPGHSLNDWARLFMGDAHNELQQSKQAETVLRELLDSKPNTKVVTDAQFGLARALETQQNQTEAFQLYRQVAQDENSNFAPRALARLGAMYFSNRQFADAAKAWDEIGDRFPASSQAQNAILNSGLAFYRGGRFEDALARLNDVDADSPLMAQSVVLKALSLKQLGRADEARVAFNEALSAAGDSPLAADILFQKAQMERTEDRLQDAAQIFEDIADRWPNDKRVADCLFNAIDLRIETGEPDRADRLWERLRQAEVDYAAQPRAQILNGRLLLALGRHKPAIAVLQQAASGVPDLTTRDGAIVRYLLAKAHFDAQQYPETVKLARELLTIVNDDQFADIRDVLVLGAVAATNAGLNEDARQFADLYLKTPGTGAQRADALAARTVALAGLKEFGNCLKDAQNLAQDFPDRAESWKAILSAANLARENMAWSDAEPLFRIAAQNHLDKSLRESALTGVAISLYRGGRFAESKTAFEKAIAESSDPDNEAHLSYLLADSVAESGQIAESAAAYLDVFDRFTPKDGEKKPNPDDSIPMKYAYDAGKQAARLFQQAGDADRADHVWEQVSNQYSTASDADAVLDEWAHMNLQREKFDRADTIHQKLLDRFPDSRFAGTAHLSLAESAILAGQTQLATAEFESILKTEHYRDLEKSNALFHLIDIAAAAADWDAASDKAILFQASYPQHELLPRVRLFLAEAQLNTGDFAEAQKIAEELRDGIVNDTAKLGPLAERAWLILARAALESARYDQIDSLADELHERFPDSPFTFQMRDLQGRRWMLQAPPDFEKARAYFRKVVDDPRGRGSRTAANCQLRIADTLRRENNLKEAVREYYRLYYNHTGNDDLRVEALYAAAVCERDLKETASAIRSLQDLIVKFPDSDRKDDAIKELQTMGAQLPQNP
jgi:TolA-binding protein